MSIIILSMINWPRGLWSYYGQLRQKGRPHHPRDTLHYQLDCHRLRQFHHHILIGRFIAGISLGANRTLSLVFIGEITNPPNTSCRVILTRNRHSHRNPDHSHRRILLGLETQLPDQHRSRCTINNHLPLSTGKPAACG